jgi:O-antigen/teichoic acid export membrane protein
MSNTKTIARNTGWYGLENIISSVLTLFTSIAIARTLGPSKMGYIIYVAWIVSVVTSLGGLGIPATTQKYMAEFLGMGDRGTARHIYFHTLWFQMALASLASIALVLWVFHDATSEYRIPAALIALSIWPAMVNEISAQGNVASEDLSANLPGSVLSMIFFFVAIMATVFFKWGVLGVGASIFLTRLLDFLIRLFPTMKRILSWEKAHVQPENLRQRMISFSWQSVASMIVALIVWDRSEFLLLKHLCSDIRQVAYYSVAFSMAERLLITSAVFGSATNATIFAQYGRDKSKIPWITASSFRYLVLSSVPLHFISAALAFPALILLYGNQYAGAALVVTLAPLLCMPKAFIGPVQSLLQSAERQSYVIGATVLAGVVDLGVAWVLIPKYGAVGACIASGAAQITAVSAMWAIGIRLFGVRLPWGHVAKVTFISTVAALAAHFAAFRFKPLVAIISGGSASLIVLFVLFYALRVLDDQDRPRLAVITAMLPKPLSGPAEKLISLLIRHDLAGATPTSV